MYTSALPVTEWLHLIPCMPIWRLDSEWETLVFLTPVTMVTNLRAVVFADVGAIVVINRHNGI